MTTQEKFYCECEETKADRIFLGKQTCTICGKRIRVFFLKIDNQINLINQNKERVSRLITGILLNGENIVTINDKSYEVHPKCLEILHKESKYRLDFEKDRTRYSEPIGFKSNDPRFRPFKPGEVKGYITNNKFYITKNTHGDKAIRILEY